MQAKIFLDCILLTSQKNYTILPNVLSFGSEILAFSGNLSDRAQMVALAPICTSSIYINIYAYIYIYIEVGPQTPNMALKGFPSTPRWDTDGLQDGFHICFGFLDTILYYNLL